MAFWAGHVNLFICDMMSLFELPQAWNVTLPRISVEYYCRVLLTNHIADTVITFGDIWFWNCLHSISKSSTFDEAGLWDAMVHVMEISAMELCYVLHGYPWPLLQNKFQANWLVFTDQLLISTISPFFFRRWGCSFLCEESCWLFISFHSIFTPYYLSIPCHQCIEIVLTTKLHFRLAGPLALWLAWVKVCHFLMLYALPSRLSPILDLDH